MSRVLLLAFLLAVVCMSAMSIPTPLDMMCHDDNKEWTTCGSACPPTCETINREPMACTLQCVIGCRCKSGYVLDSQNRCVPQERCEDD